MGLNVHMSLHALKTRIKQTARRSRIRDSDMIRFLYAWGKRCLQYYNRRLWFYPRCGCCGSYGSEAFMATRHSNNSRTWSGWRARRWWWYPRFDRLLCKTFDCQSTGWGPPEHHCFFFRTGQYGRVPLGNSKDWWPDWLVGLRRQARELQGNNLVAISPELESRLLPCR